MPLFISVATPMPRIMMMGRGLVAWRVILYYACVRFFDAGEK